MAANILGFRDDIAKQYGVTLPDGAPESFDDLGAPDSDVPAAATPDPLEEFGDPETVPEPTGVDERYFDPVTGQQKSVFDQ